MCFYSFGQLLVLERLVVFSFPSLRLQPAANPANLGLSSNSSKSGRVVVGILLAMLCIGWLCVIAASSALMAVNVAASGFRSKQLDAWSFAATEPSDSSENIILLGRNMPISSKLYSHL